MAYSLVDFAKSLRVDHCKIQNTPNFIFLCGGPTATDGSCQSARDSFFRHLRSEKPAWVERVKLAEDVNAGFHNTAAFPDLLELENYLGYLAHMTVLFVESPGSIAELGAFAASDTLSPKLLAVLNTYYDSEQSFIADGPIRKIRNDKEELVQYYSWDPKQLDTPKTKKEFGEVADQLTKILEDLDQRRPSRIAFQADQTSHTLLLVADLIRIPGVASKSDVASCLEELHCKDAIKNLDRHLSVLQSVDIIKMHRRSNGKFYANNFLKPLIRYAYFDRPGVIRDAMRVQTAVRGNLDPVRRGVLRTLLREPS